MWAKISHFLAESYNLLVWRQIVKVFFLESHFVIISRFLESGLGWLEFKYSYLAAQIALFGPSTIDLALFGEWIVQFGPGWD